jgi:type IV secretion system protein VirD4
MQRDTRKDQRLPSQAFQPFAIFHKLIPLSLIFSGLWLSTQRFAQLCCYSSSLGPVWFERGSTPVYRPWMFLAWAYKFIDWPPVHDYLWQASIWFGAFSVLAIIVYLLLSFFRGRSSGAENLYGTARWATISDLRRNGLLFSSGVICGQSAEARIRADASSGATRYHLRKTSRLIGHAGETSTLMVAPSRSGKGVSTVIPTLLSWTGSTIVFDPKAENWHICAGFRSKFSHVLRFSPVLKNSVHFNILDEVRTGENSVRDAEIIADILTAPQDDSSAKGENQQHFIDTAKNLLTGAILHVLACPECPDKSLGGVLDFLSSSALDADGNEDFGAGICKQMLFCEHLGGVHSIVTSIANQQLARADRERSSVLSTAVRAVQIFKDPLIRRNTSISDFRLADFAESQSPISLFLTVPYSDIDRLSALLRLLISFVIRRFAEGETRYGDVRMKNRILFLLDEFPILGSFPFLEKTMGLLSGYGMSFLIICQSLQQLIKLYGPNNSFLEHCKTWITYAPGDLNSARTFSEVIGKESVWKESVSSSGSKFAVGLTHLNLSGNEVERNLINPDEIMRLPPTDLLVFAHGMPPYRGKKVIYYLDLRFRHIANLPVPETREDLVRELPNPSMSANPWSVLEFEETESSFTEPVANQSQRKADEALNSGSIFEKDVTHIPAPEDYLPPDLFEPNEPIQDAEETSVESPFGTFRRSER